MKPSFLGLPGYGRAYPMHWLWHCHQIHVSKKTHLSPNGPLASLLPRPVALNNSAEIGLKHSEGSETQGGGVFLEPKGGGRTMNGFPRAPGVSKS